MAAAALDGGAARARRRASVAADEREAATARRDARGGLRATSGCRGRITARRGIRLPEIRTCVRIAGCGGAGRNSGVEQADTLPGLAKLNNLVRSVQTPDFAGVTFHEVLAKSALNRCPGQSAMPFGWTINPYRGCSHACVYCFARPTHTYLDLDAGDDFDRQIIVKVNVGRRAAHRAREAVVAARAGRARHQHRSVPARRGPLRAHAGHHRRARRRAARRSASSPRARCCVATCRCSRRPPSTCPSTSRCRSRSTTTSCSSRSSRAPRARRRGSPP